MATEAISGIEFVATADDRTTTATRELMADERPYRPSWVNVLLDWIERLPGPTWLAYVVLGP